MSYNITNNGKPPSNTRFIMGRQHLSKKVGLATYRITNKATNDASIIKVKGRMRQTLDVLAISPVYCASPIRLGAYVELLRNDYGVKIHTEMYCDKSQEPETRYGTYTLLSKVEYIGEMPRKAVA